MTLLKSPIPFCSLKFIDELPRVREVDDRLKETLREIRNRKLMAAGSVDHGNDPVLWHQLINDSDRKMTKRRAIRCLERMQSLSGMNHLPDPAKAQLNALRDGVSVTRILTEHKADEIAAALHEEMPWMAPATEEVWQGLRRSAREGLPGLRFNPLVLVGSPGIGKSFWARRLAHHLGVPTTKIDATGEPATFSLVGTQRGWSSATPGKLMQTVLLERHAGPLVIVDEVEKTRDVNAVNGARHSLTDALLPLLERMTAETWECPFYQIRFDMSWANWVLTANSRKGLSQCDITLREHEDVNVSCSSPGYDRPPENWEKYWGTPEHPGEIFDANYKQLHKIIDTQAEISGEIVLCRLTKSINS